MHIRSATGPRKCAGDRVRAAHRRWNSLCTSVGATTWHRSQRSASALAPSSAPAGPGGGGGAAASSAMARCRACRLPSRWLASCSSDVARTSHTPQCRPASSPPGLCGHARARWCGRRAQRRLRGGALPVRSERCTPRAPHRTTRRRHAGLRIVREVLEARGRRPGIHAQRPGAEGRQACQATCSAVSVAAGTARGRTAARRCRCTRARVRERAQAPFGHRAPAPRRSPRRATPLAGRPRPPWSHRPPAPPPAGGHTKDLLGYMSVQL